MTASDMSKAIESILVSAATGSGDAIQTLQTNKINVALQSLVIQVKFQWTEVDSLTDTANLKVGVGWLSFQDTFQFTATDKEQLTATFTLTLGPAPAPPPAS